MINPVTAKGIWTVPCKSYDYTRHGNARVNIHWQLVTSLEAQLYFVLMEKRRLILKSTVCDEWVSTMETSTQRWFPYPLFIHRFADWVGSTGKLTRFWVRSKFQIVCLHVEPALSSFSERCMSRGYGGQRWSTILCAADSPMSIRLCFLYCCNRFCWIMHWNLHK